MILVISMNLQSKPRAAAEAIGFRSNSQPEGCQRSLRAQNHRRKARTNFEKSYLARPLVLEDVVKTTMGVGQDGS